MRGIWSGVSLQRYRTLISLLAQDYSLLYRQKSSSQSYDDRRGKYFVGMTLPLLMQILISKTVTKRCLLEYYLALEASLGTTILREEYNDLREEGSDMQNRWLHSEYGNEELTSALIEDAVHRLFQNDFPLTHSMNPVPLISTLKFNDTSHSTFAAMNDSFRRFHSHRSNKDSSGMSLTGNRGNITKINVPSSKQCSHNSSVCSYHLPSKVLWSLSPPMACPPLLHPCILNRILQYLLRIL